MARAWRTSRWAELAAGDPLSPEFLAMVRHSDDEQATALLVAAVGAFAPENLTVGPSELVDRMWAPTAAAADGVSLLDVLRLLLPKQPFPGPWLADKVRAALPVSAARLDAAIRSGQPARIAAALNVMRVNDLAELRALGVDPLHPAPAATPGIADRRARLTTLALAAVHGADHAPAQVSEEVVATRAPVLPGIGDAAALDNPTAGDLVVLADFAATWLDRPRHEVTVVRAEGGSFVVQAGGRPVAQLVVSSVEDAVWRLWGIDVARQWGAQEIVPSVVYGGGLVRSVVGEPRFVLVEALPSHEDVATAVTGAGQRDEVLAKAAAVEAELTELLGRRRDGELWRAAADMAAAVPADLAERVGLGDLTTVLAHTAAWAEGLPEDATPALVTALLLGTRFSPDGRQAVLTDTSALRAMADARGRPLPGIAAGTSFAEQVLAWLGSSGTSSQDVLDAYLSARTDERSLTREVGTPAARVFEAMARIRTLAATPGVDEQELASAVAEVRVLVDGEPAETAVGDDTVDDTVDGDWVAVHEFLRTLRGVRLPAHVLRSPAGPTPPCVPPWRWGVPVSWSASSGRPTRRPSRSRTARSPCRPPPVSRCGCGPVRHRRSSPTG